MKTIKVKDSLGNEYVLEYNRKSVERLESQGFSIQKIAEMPMTMLPILFAGAFLKNHKKTSSECIEKLLAGLPDKSKLINVLLEMYNEPIAVMLDDPEDDSEGNVTWEASK